MSRVLFLAAVAMAVTGAARAADFVLPPDTAVLQPGPHLETAQAVCSACHSADYILTQPRGFADPKAFWSGEVTKMRKVYGAQMEDAQAAEIAEYLSATYAK